METPVAVTLIIVSDLHLLLNGHQIVLILVVVAMVVAIGRASGLDHVIVKPRSATLILASLIAAGCMIWVFWL